MMLNGKERAAILLSVLGSEYSEKILDHLPSDVSGAIAEVLSKGRKKPSTDDISEIIDKFSMYMSNPEPETDEDVDEEAASPAAKGKRGDPVNIIIKASSDSIALAIKGERPEFIAFVLSHLPVNKINEILSKLGNLRREVEEKLIHMKDVPMTEVFQDQVLDIVAKRLA